MKKNIAVIGSGFSSFAASCYLAKSGHNVTIYEKNQTIGGRARQFKKDGFTFDMGPTWYWMPDVVERFFKDFGKVPSDFYKLKKLSAAYRVYFGANDFITIGDSLEKICAAFESEEPGSSIKLRQFMAQALDNYNIAIKDLVYSPGVSPLELVTLKTMGKIGQFFSTVSKDVRREFTNPKLISILEFPVLFLGAKPSKTPAFYSCMNYADFGLGTFHPENGMYSVVNGIKKLAEELGVSIKTDQNVEKIFVENGKASAILVNGEKITADIILSGSDYHHTETLLEDIDSQCLANYWQKKALAPSALLFYVGFDKKIENVDHHTLFFDVDFEKHSQEIYDAPKWPNDP